MGQALERLRDLSDQDLRFLVSAVVRRRTDYDTIVELIRDKPDIVDVMLDDPRIVEQLEANQHLLLQISPFLLFTILIRRAHRELKESVFTMEVGAEGRLPVFDAREAASLLDDPDVRTYLAEMLASFTRTDTATVVMRGRRGLVRRTYSDLNVDDLIAISEMVEETYRFPFFKRVADLCLFLTGMFPEHLVPWTGSGRGGFRSRQRRSLADYESLGREFYQKAAQTGGAQAGERVTVLNTLAEAFTLARKPLGLIAERYIGDQRHQWFRIGRDSGPAQHE